MFLRKTPRKKDGKPRFQPPQPPGLINVVIRKTAVPTSDVAHSSDGRTVKIHISSDRRWHSPARAHEFR
jgi:hypothetical protein